MIFHSIFPIDIIVDLCHFEPPNIQYVHDPNTVMRPIIWIGRGNGFKENISNHMINVMLLIPNMMMMGMTRRGVVWDRNNLVYHCNEHHMCGLVKSGISR